LALEAREVLAGMAQETAAMVVQEVLVGTAA
jgi:hypothetical protein